jgi:hypothetical protein
MFWKGPVPGSFDKKERRRCHLFLSKRWHLLPVFLSKRAGPGTDHVTRNQGKIIRGCTSVYMPKLKSNKKSFPKHANGQRKNGIRSATEKNCDSPFCSHIFNSLVSLTKARSEKKELTSRLFPDFLSQFPVG